MGTISVRGVGKAYKQYRSRWGRLAEWLLPWGGARHSLHWVLQDLDFEVGAGEAVGIIGVNGAGKSTLLKLITGTASPTTGSISVNGRVAAMLELGMGFHPDFTGRQNVYMAGQLLGLTTGDIDQLMPDIEAFAEIGEYIDMPVRVYSSGMQVRLAFSVATCRVPDVLIIDEALSVGDAYFQHKSFGRIREYRLRGTTLLIVSHDKTAIQSICDRAILLERGRIAMEGEPESVMDYYNGLIADQGTRTVRQEGRADGGVSTVSGTGEATLGRVRLLDAAGHPVEMINVGQRVTLEVEAVVREAIPELVLGYVIKDRLGQPVFGTNTHHLKRTLHDLSPGERFVFTFDFTASLGPGAYSIALALHARDAHIVRNYEWRDLALVLNVVNLDKSEFVGVGWLPPEVEIQDER